MKLEQFGIDPETLYHKKIPLTVEENAFLGILWVDHVGKDNKIPARHFAERFASRLGFYWEEIEHWKRQVRHMHNHVLFDHNVPVLSKSGTDGGYWIAGSDEEGKEFYDTFRRRGLTGLVKASRGKKSAMVDMITQLSFSFDDLVDKTLTAQARPAQGVPAPIEIVDAFLEKMLKDPEDYAEGLRKIGEKYGSVLMPKKRFDDMIGAMKMKTREMQGIIDSLEG